MEHFEKVLANYNSKEGINISPYFIHRKTSYVRITLYSPGFEINHRVSNEKWDQLIGEYREKMQLDDGSLITCIVT
jgi:hypothetical protein